jgi:hypothetical protein
MRWKFGPSAGRADAWEAQRELQVPVFEALLGELEARREVTPVSGRAGWFRPARPVRAIERLQLYTYSRRSIVRATSRWLKHTVTFEGWLDYIIRKASRHGGETIELTDRERRWPLVFLWGRAFRYLRTKNRKESPR